MIRVLHPVSRDEAGLVRVDGEAYFLKALRGGYRLVNVENGTCYDLSVCESTELVECDCGDYVWRREVRGEPCKHVRWLYTLKQQGSI